MSLFIMSWMTRPLEGVLEERGMTVAQIALFANSNDRYLAAATPLELWAHWFSAHVQDDAEFISERALSGSVASTALTLVYRVDHEVRTMPIVRKVLDRRDRLIPDLVELCGSFLLRCVEQ
jgi:hypothetical protein